MSRILGCVLAVCAVLGASQPVDKQPVLKQLPSEVLFRENKEFVLECVTEGKEQGVSYKWTKNGHPLSPNANIVQRDNEGTLVFKSPKKNDEGLYQCLAESDVGVGSSRVRVNRAYIDVPQVELQKHKPIEGKPYKLNCRIPASYPKPEISWLIQSLSDTSASRNVMDRRINLSPEGDLYFSNVTSEDVSGGNKYVCVAKSDAVDHEVVLAEHVLEDLVPSTEATTAPVLQYASEDFTAKLGAVTMIYCIYGGTPLAHPDWYKDGKNVNNNPSDRVTRYNRSSGKRLLIKDTWLEDQGTYTCIVDNEVGKPQTHIMHLTVVSSPQFNKKPDNKLIVKSGKDVTIPCQIAGVPAPRISWSLNAKELAQSDKLHIHNSSHGNVTVADLTIGSAQPGDAGYYGCRGQNDHGEVYAEVLVIVQ